MLIRNLKIDRRIRKIKWHIQLRLIYLHKNALFVLIVHQYVTKRAGGQKEYGWEYQGVSEHLSGRRGSRIFGRHYMFTPHILLTQ